ncbi:SapB/AmfS family lanthipeptide [Pendulispora albinea]|uniref:SapB/AmfS family lanthipeptide n=1 Tax=Pendulispora albinea TaxID=2741071 RepID=A0ABZ2M5N0_9BACT
MSILDLQAIEDASEVETSDDSFAAGSDLSVLGDCGDSGISLLLCG